MAIWQFRMSMLPREGVRNKLGCIPSVFEEYKSDFSFSGSATDENDVNYWKGYSLSGTVSAFSEIFIEKQSWDERMRLFEVDSGSKVEVWQDDVYIKYDARNPDYTLLKKVVNIARDLKCILVSEEDGKMIEPEFSSVLECFQNSRAYRVKENPENVLEEIKNLQKD